MDPEKAASGTSSLNDHQELELKAHGDSPSADRDHLESNYQNEGPDDGCCGGGGKCCGEDKAEFSNSDDGICGDDDQCCKGDGNECCGDNGDCSDNKDECSSDKDECCKGDGNECCGDNGDCSDNKDECSSDKDECCKGDGNECCDGAGSCCAEDQKDRVDVNGRQDHTVHEKEQLQRSVATMNCCGSGDDDQSMCSSSDAEKLETCCVPGVDAPIKHKVLRFRRTKGKTKDEDCCDEQCVTRLAKALCENECHGEIGEVCATHESVANHYSTFLDDKREILWRCICSLMRQLEMPQICCRDNGNRSSNGQRLSFLNPRSATAISTSRGGRNLNLGHDLHHMAKEASYNVSGSCIAPDDDPEKSLVPEKLSISVMGMNCASCEKKLARSSDRIIGVTSASSSFLVGKAQIEYYPTITSPKQICAELQRTTGFKVSVLRTDDDAFYFISRRPCAGDGAEMLPDNTWKVVYDPVTITAREKMTALGLEVCDILPTFLSDEEVTSMIFGVTIDKETRKLCGYFLVALVLTIPILVLSWGSFKTSTDLARSIVCLVLATVIQVACARKIYVSVYYTLTYGYDLDSDCLVALSTSVAYLYSVIIFALHRRGSLLNDDEIFESSSLLLTLVLFGKLITTFIRRVAADQVKFDVFQPTTMKLKQFGIEAIPASLLQYGDRIVLDAGDQAVTDGIVVSGQGEFEESHINGESLPILKKRGQEVLAGANLVSGSVVFRATRLVPENSVSNIKLLVNSVTSFRTRTSDIVDVVAKYLTPVMLCIAGAVFMIWTLVGTQVRHQDAGEAISTAITYAIATLAVACPCALVLVIPLVFSMGVAAGKSSYGVLLKSAEPTIIAGKIKHVVFDKTGTLTTDQLRVQHCWFNEATDYPVRDIIRAIVSESKHPISRSVSTYLNKLGDTLAIVGEVENVVGSGMMTTYKANNGESITILCGKPSFVGIPPTHTRVSQLHDSGFTLFCVGIKNGPILAILGITATIRDDCRPVLDALRARGITVHVLSGDTLPAVEMLCHDLGITNYVAETSPEGKNEYIESLKAAGSKVLFCGDGANDAIALAQADIGLSMTKEGITLAAADACVLNSEVSGVINLLDLSKQINYRVIVSVTWACVYNLFAVLIVSGAFVKVRIGPAWAGVSEVISITPVFFVALSMKWAGYRK
ncbi:E1-E2 ATPase-domain-containing protein [Lipomyces starkeyi]